MYIIPQSLLDQLATDILDKILGRSVRPDPEPCWFWFPLKPEQMQGLEEDLRQTLFAEMVYSLNVYGFEDRKYHDKSVRAAVAAANEEILIDDANPSAG